MPKDSRHCSYGIAFPGRGNAPEDKCKGSTRRDGSIGHMRIEHDGIYTFTMTTQSQDGSKSWDMQVVETIVNSHKHSVHPPLPTAPGYEAILNQRFHVLVSG